MYSERWERHFLCHVSTLCLCGRENPDINNNTSASGLCCVTAWRDVIVSHAVNIYVCVCVCVCVRSKPIWTAMSGLTLISLLSAEICMCWISHLNLRTREQCQTHTHTHARTHARTHTHIYRLHLSFNGYLLLSRTTVLINTLNPFGCAVLKCLYLYDKLQFSLHAYNSRSRREGQSLRMGNGIKSNKSLWAPIGISTH